MQSCCWLVMFQFSLDRQDASPCTTAASRMPFSTHLLLAHLLLQSLAQWEQGSLEQTLLCTPASLILVLWLGFLDLTSLLAVRMTSSCFHWPQLLPLICCSLKDAKQDDDIWASSQKHCRNISFLYLSSYCSHTHTPKLSSTSYWTYIWTVWFVMGLVMQKEKSTYSLAHSTVLWKYMVCYCLCIIRGQPTLLADRLDTRSVSITPEADESLVR